MYFHGVKVGFLSVTPILLLAACPVWSSSRGDSALSFARYQLLHPAAAAAVGIQRSPVAEEDTETAGVMQEET